MAEEQNNAPQPTPDGEPPAPESEAPAPGAETPGSDAAGGEVNAEEMAEQAIDYAQASAADLEKAMAEAMAAEGDEAEADGGGMSMPDFGAAAAEAMPGIDMLGDVELHVTIELGRTRMLVEDVLRLASGSVVELDKLAGDPVDVYVNDCLIARGEVLVLNDNFCIRISEIVENLEERAETAAMEQAQAS